MFCPRTSIPLRVLAQLCVLGGLLLACSCASTSHGGGYRGRSSREGAYVTGHVGAAWLSGAFDFQDELYGSDQILLPHTDVGVTTDVALGLRSEEGFGAEIAFIRESYAGHIGRQEADVELDSISLRFAQHYDALNEVHLYAIAGVLYSWGTLENSSRTWDAVDAGARSFEDAELSQGWGIEAGAGLAIPLSRELELDIRCMWTERTFYSASGASGYSDHISGGLDAPALKLMIGLTLGF